LTTARVGIVGTGIVCALGSEPGRVIDAIAQGRSGIRPLTCFKVVHPPALPVGQALDWDDAPDRPRCHQLARMAADQAMAACPQPPDAIVLGVTTGGMATTEALFRQDCRRPEAYRHHGLGTVAEDLANRFHCQGPVLTVSTACSSGAAAIGVALTLIRSGRYQRVLTGGVDSLCRLTYFGFKSLQLIDPQGCRPLDQGRRGMSVAEGAGMLVLESRNENQDGIDILGAGFSCDAHHPAQPHPQGLGAKAAMEAALRDAGIERQQIDYINLHGTGTTDNDRSEAFAVNALFDYAPPPLSSIKGAIGHCLAASGAIEAALAAHCIAHGWMPANTGCLVPDPDLHLTPLKHSVERPIQTVLSNSFGFGGNNTALVIGRSGHSQSANPNSSCRSQQHPLTLVGWSVVTGAGFDTQTIDNLSAGQGCHGCLDAKTLGQGLAVSAIRRLKRLSLMALALSTHACHQGREPSLSSVFLGTGWGSLSETHDFIQGLFESDEKFASPTDFIGSVHNAAAGQIALMAQATGTNLTLSGGDYSFEQALFCAQMMAADNASMLVLGADEGHSKLSPLFDPSVAADKILSDGGGALILKRTPEPIGPRVALKYFSTGFGHPPDLVDLVAHLGGAESIQAKYGLILAGLPAAQRPQCQEQLDLFRALTGYRAAVIDYRRLTGEFATSSAVATVFAAVLVQNEWRPLSSCLRQAIRPEAGAALILGLGSALTAIEVGPA
jgi:3-oxoacyl-(acyl-carrier-protein) synthase